MDIVSKVRKLRYAKGYSQEYMAMKLGVTQSAYCKLEKNGRRIKFEQVEKIASILEVDISELVETV